MDGHPPLAHHRGVGQQPHSMLNVTEAQNLAAGADSLLQPHVVVGVTEKLRWKRRMGKSTYDRTARDLPKLIVGDWFRMSYQVTTRVDGRWTNTRTHAKKLRKNKKSCGKTV